MEAATSLVRYVGRFDTADPAGPRFAWPGTSIIVSFTGSGLDVALGDSGTNFFGVIVDGAPPAILATSGGKEVYTVASDLAPGVHTVVLTKRTESFVGVVQLRGLTPHDGVLVAAPPPRPRRIEYVGDSITCGYGDLGANETCRFSADTEDETIAYGALAAEELGAERSNVAVSGIGMYRSSAKNTADQIPALFERTLARGGAPWGFAPEPDVVVINLGTNDYASGDPGVLFEDAYLAFLERVRGHYPRARIVCAVSPMMTDRYPLGAEVRTRASAAIQRIVRARAAAGDDRVSYFAFDEQSGANGYGCDYHPSAATHALMARSLVRELKILLGW